MFNLGMMEILLVLAVAFLIVGPKDLPKVAKWLARQIKTLKKLIREIKKETGWDEFAKEFKDTADDIKSVVKDADIREDVKAATDELRSSVEEVRQEVESVRKGVDDASKELKQNIEV